MRFENQATFHPRTYLNGLVEAFTRDGGLLFEETQVAGVEEASGGCRVNTDHGVVTARDVIVAAHVPISNRFLLHTKLAAYRTYAVAFEHTAPGEDGLFWDLAEPYHYTRRQKINGRDFVIVGGDDHKVGEDEDTAVPFIHLENYVREKFAVEVGPTDYRWSGQIIVPVDGLPLIGRNSASTHVYVASGYSGNGITNGTLAAMVMADQIVLGNSRFTHLFDPTRIKPIASAKSFISENADFPKHLIQDRMPHPGPEAVAPSRRARGRCWRSAASAWPSIATPTASSARCRRSARTSAAWCTGTPRRRAGTARATAVGSIRMAAS